MLSVGNLAVFARAHFMHFLSSLQFSLVVRRWWLVGLAAGLIVFAQSALAQTVKTVAIAEKSAAPAAKAADSEKDKGSTDKDKDTAKNEFTPDAIAARRAALQKEIAATRTDFDKLPEGKQDETALWLTQEIAWLERTDSLYAEQLRTLQHEADLQKESAEITELTKNPRPAEVRFKPPYGLALLDQLYDEREYLTRARDLLKTDVENATTALADARDDAEDRDRARRTAKEAAAKPADVNKAQRALRLAELECRQAHETVLLREKALATLKLQQSLIEPKLALLTPDFQWLHNNLKLSDADAAAAKAKRDKRLEELDTAIVAAREEADKVARLVVATERRAGDADKASDELEARRADRQTVNLSLSVLSAQKERQATFAEVTKLRLRALAGDASSAEMKAWAEANNDALLRLEKERRPQMAELRKSRRDLQELQNKLADPAAPERKEAWANDRLKRLQAWVALNERELIDTAALATARNRLKEELGDHVSTFSWHDSVLATKANVLDAWNYEVFSVSDQPIRVKTLLGVIVLIFVGHWVSRRASDMIGRTVFRRMGMNTGGRAAWQTLSFYAFFLIVLLWAFNLFNLSLTQFSVVSGALAVGIGFGSQNLIGNFISGIILLLERPVNQGDVIEIDGQQVTVERLGPRSTIVRSGDNTHVIVPNSRLLEENVINWTLSDDVIRKRIRIGVSYDSNTREVARLAEEVLLGMELVKREPAPLVTFIDFGENALIFEASFWSSLGERVQIESELRHRLAETFAKAGIKMAFPQRDVHLETTGPLRVELVGPEKAVETRGDAAGNS